MNDSAAVNSEAGKEQIDALLAKMSPEQQVEFKAALAGNKPVHVHVGKDGAITLGEDAAKAAVAAGAAPASVEPAPEAPVELKKEEPEEPRKMTKLELKRQEIFRDRMRRKMGEKTKDGKLKDQQQALQEIQREDYEALPLDKKFARLESILASSIQNLSVDMMNLNQGHLAIADAFDINYRAIQKLFVKLGVSNDEQKLLIDESQKEVIEEKKAAQAAAQAARVAEQKARQDNAEKMKLEKELNATGKLDSQKKDEPVGAEIPKEATVFGG